VFQVEGKEIQMQWGMGGRRKDSDMRYILKTRAIKPDNLDAE
jgi:hypothetical protein